MKLSILFEELHDNSKINKIVEHIYLAHRVLDKNLFTINKYFEKEGYDTHGWEILCQFDKTNSSSSPATTLVSFNKHKFIITVMDKKRSPDNIMGSIEHEVIHILDYLKSINKNKGELGTQNIRKNYDIESLSYYKHPIEFNQLIHFIKKLTHTYKFNSYEDLINNLNKDRRVLVDKKMAMDPSFKKRLLSRLARENILIFR
jgi:hypothetical protein